MNKHHRFYVLTRHKMGISGKDIFAELSLTNKDTCPSLHTSARPNIQKVKGLIEENCPSQLFTKF